VLLMVTRNPLVALAGGFIGLLGAPRWLLSYLRKRRVKRFIDELPNALDVVVRGIRAGLPLADCIRMIANEAREPLRSEFKTLVEAQAVGLSIADACSKLYDRVPVAEANFFAIVIQIQSKSGGNLSEAIGNLSRVLRERKKMAGKIAAMSMEAKASAAIIACLPFVVAILTYISSPKYIELLWTTQTGKFVMVASGLWMLTGILVMKKMISFKI
jgi:tight adherence protein B